MAQTGIVSWIFLALWLLLATQVDEGASRAQITELARVDSPRDDDIAQARPLDAQAFCQVTDTPRPQQRH